MPPYGVPTCTVSQHRNGPCACHRNCHRYTAVLRSTKCAQRAATFLAASFRAQRCAPVNCLSDLGRKRPTLGVRTPPPNPTSQTGRAVEAADPDHMESGASTILGKSAPERPSRNGLPWLNALPLEARHAVPAETAWLDHTRRDG